jgi:hypothetical protein
MCHQCVLIVRGTSVGHSVVQDNTYRASVDRCATLDPIVVSYNPYLLEAKPVKPVLLAPYPRKPQWIISRERAQDNVQGCEALHMTMNGWLPYITEMGGHHI